MINTSLADALNKAGLPAAMMAQRNPVVGLSRKKKFVLIFGCPLHLVPEGIQVLPQCGGNTCSVEQQRDPGAPRFNNAKIDLPGLLARVSVHTINVSGGGQWCQVYVNCSTQANEQMGLNSWKGIYEIFVRKALSNVWGTAILKESENKISLVLRRVVQDPLPATIHFAIR